jgi:TolA-binding protein
MLRALPLTAVVVALVAIAGCATPLTAKRPSEADADLQQQVFKLQKDSARILRVLEELRDNRSQGGGQEGACAEAATRVAELDRRIDVLEEQLLATQSKIDEAISGIRSLRRSGLRDDRPPLPGVFPRGPGEGEAAPSDASADGTAGEESGEAGAEGGGQSDGGAPASASPEDLFNAAYADFSRGEYESALAGFESALRMDPEGPVATTAQFYMAETLLAMERYTDAVAAYDALISQEPNSDKALTAQLKRGIALFEARRTVEGVQALQSLIENHPDSDEARIAEEYFRRKGISRD